MASKLALRVLVRERRALVSIFRHIICPANLNGPSGISVPTTSTVNWFSGRYVLNSTVVAPGAKTGEKAECRTPDVLGFSHSGREYHVDVPEGQFENIAQLLHAGEYEALREIAREA